MYKNETFPGADISERNDLKEWCKDNISADKAIFWLFAGAFLGMPLGTSPPIICGGIAAAIWLFSGRIRKLRHFLERSCSMPILLFMLLPWLGLLYTPDLKGLGLDYAGKVHYWIYCLALGSVPLGLFRPKKLIQAFLIGLAINAVAGGFQLAGLMPPKGDGWCSGFGRGYSTLSAYLVLGMLAASFMFRKTEEKKTRIGLCFLMLLYFFHLVILNGRTGYVTFLLLSPLIIRNFFGQFRIIRISVGCAVLLGMMFLSPVVRDRVALSVEQLNYHLNAAPEDAWGREYNIENQDRFYMWRGAVHIFVENPLFGVGTGGYQKALKARGRPEDPPIAHPHNDLLHMAVSYGIMGIFVFFWLFGEMIKNAWPHRHTLTGNFVLSAIWVILVSGLFNAHTLDAGMVFLLAVSAGLLHTIVSFGKGSGKT